MSEQQWPAGWYQPGDQPGVERWWDGAKWTEYTRPPGAGAPPAPRVIEVGDSRPPHFWAAAVGGAIAVAGLLGPWANVLGGVVTRTGLDTADGKLVGVLLLLAGLALFSSLRSRGARLTGAVLGAVTVAVSIVDLADVNEKIGGNDYAEVGWGLYAVMFGSGLLTLTMGIWFFVTQDAPASSAAQPAAGDVR